MRDSLLKVFVLLCVACNVTKAAKPKILACYYTNWSQYRPGVGRFTPANIDPFLCTHIIYAFANLKNGQLLPFEWNDAAMYAGVLDLKRVNPSLKVILSVGGWNMGSAPFNYVSDSGARRNVFAVNALAFLNKYGFDGLDLDWEYPDAAHKKKHWQLLKSISVAFRKEAKTKGTPRKLLGAALSAHIDSIDTRYDLKKMTRSLDLFNIMTYDMYGGWSHVTGIHSALFPRRNDPDPKLTQSDVMRAYVQRGVPRVKLLLGIPTYGRSMTLKSGVRNRLGAETIRAGGLPGEFTRESGFLSYYEIQDRIQNQGWKSFYHADHVGNYAFKKKQWVGYDTPDTAIRKVQYSLTQRFGGVFVWSLDLDDFRGTYGQSIIGSIKNALFEGTTQTTPQPYTGPSTTTSTTTTTTTTTIAPAITVTQPGGAGVFVCPANNPNGLFKDIKDCTRYWHCDRGIAYNKPCNLDLQWNNKKKWCDWPENVPNCNP